MLRRFSLYNKINIMLIGMLLPLIILNAYSYQTGNSVVRHEIEKSAETNLALLIQQLDAMTEQLSSYALTLNRDSSVRTLINSTYFEGPYSKYSIVTNLEDKLKLFSASTNWNSTFSVYAPHLNEMVSNSSSLAIGKSFPEKPLESGWRLHSADQHYGDDNYFVRYFSEPAIVPEKAVSSYQVITEVTFAQSNVVKILDSFKSRSNINDPLLFQPGLPPLTSSSANSGMTARLISELEGSILGTSGSTTLSMDGMKYLVTYQTSKTLGWYLIDYVLLNDTLAPIRQSSQIFYITVGVLVLIGFLLSFMIYRNVQTPIFKLVSAVRAIMRGDYSTQIVHRSINEFQFLIVQFNAMALQIKELIEKEYESKIRLQEATLKQLQSQIDPHFLYNSLNFIKNSAKMGDEEAVVSMCVNLGAYYRYSTRLEKPMTPLAEEISLIRNYLEIHRLRKHDMSYEVSLPDTVEGVEIPRLLLQPVVENAIVHGIDRLAQPGTIRIRGEETEDQYRMIIEDNGPGMTEQEIEALNQKITSLHNEEQLCGLWNVSQRLILHYGEPAGVDCSPSPLGGLKVKLYWPR